MDVFVVEDPREHPVALPPGAKSLNEETACYSDKNAPRSVRAELRGASFISKKSNVVSTPVLPR